ncbi:cytochrome b-c1 complex subunit 1, mitochondrial-like [Spodoptera litura]|uniref:Cytochrome b-c1 complex subunit 1, mitochondrial-like n=1 Tax=Spodoptera litura TaxID=69820 RepID=A0A9J7J1J6_SPOLT|nr:cytochrome b-c1 complex subunit 1, mitochondrial-like [Spodoptera litura]
MRRTLLKSVSSLSIKRQYGWKPVEPMDPCIQVTILHNGVKIATEEVKSPLACVTLSVAAGSRYETKCTNGLTHFIEHMAFKGFRSMSKEKFEEAVAHMGAKMTVQTSREMQVFSVVLPSEMSTAAVDKLSKIICDIEFSDDEVCKEKKNISLELNDNDINPKQLVFDYLHATAFQGTPLAQRVMGTSENLDNFDAVMVDNFMTDQYQPYRFVIATSGEVSHDKIMQYAEPRFGCITPQPCREAEPGPSRYTGSQVVFRDDSMPFCYAAIAFEAPGYFSSHYLSMLVMSYIVGSWDKSQSRGENHAPLVARAVSCANLCERYETFYIPYRDIGLWGVYFVADKWKLDVVVSYIQEQWLQLCTMVQNTDIERGLNALRLTFARQYGSVVSSSHDIGKQMLYTSGRKSLEHLLESLNNIKVDNIRNVATQMMYDKCPAVAVVGPSETMPDYNRIRAGQWWLRV